MKNIIPLVLALVAHSFHAVAQVNYYKLSADGHTGFTTYYGDVDSYTPPKPTIKAMLTYSFTPNIHTSVEIQWGIISAGDSILDPHKRFFKNAYRSVSINFAVGGSAGSDPFWNIMGGLQAGLGAGMIMNNHTEIIRTVKKKSGIYRFPGTRKSTHLVVPISLGYTYYFHDRWNYPRLGFLISYQFNITSGEGVDGYSDPPEVFRNNYPDMYSVSAVGISYKFGAIGFRW